MKRHISFQVWLLLLAASIIAACSQSPETASESGKLKVVATTSIVADVVRNIGGEQIILIPLLPYGSDPHSYNPTPQDLVKISDAEVIFSNGLGLEAFLDPLFESAGVADKVVPVSEGITTIHSDNGERGEDPHTWTDPNNVLIWVDNIEETLINLDPGHENIYRSNAESFRRELIELDDWIRSQTNQLPDEKRNIITDHLIFGYFANKYGFTQVGTIIPGYSSLAGPSAQSLAELETTINKMGLKVIFIGETVNPDLAERIADDTGTKLVFLYTGSLSEQGGDADTYLKYMRHNTNAIVENLKD